MARVNRDKLLEVIIKGLEHAQFSYLRWTKDTHSVGTGAEYVLTTYVAEKVFELYNDIVYIEKSIEEIVEDSNSSLTKLEDSLRLGRADIALYSLNKDNNKPKMIIELKNNVNSSKKLQQDINRIQVLVDAGVIEYGILAFVTEVERKRNYNIDELNSKLHKIMMDCTNYDKSFKYKYKYRYDSNHPERTDYETYFSWGCGVILFTK